MATAGTELIDPHALLKRVQLHAAMHVADLGCGVTGHIIVPAAQLVGNEGKAYAVDIQKSALAATEGKARLDGVANVTTIWSDIERVGATKIPPGSLDVAMLVNTVHMTKRREAVFQEAARLTKSGGTVLVVDWVVSASPVGPPAAQRVDEDTIRKAATAAGLSEREAFRAGPYHYGLMFTKP